MQSCENVTLSSDVFVFENDKHGICKHLTGIFFHQIQDKFKRVRKKKLLRMKNVISPNVEFIGSNNEIQCRTVKAYQKLLSARLNV